MTDNNNPASSASQPTTIQAHISLGMIANTVESFSGKEKIIEYFDKLEIRAKLDFWDEATTLNILKYRLTGEAYRYYKTDQSTFDTLDYTNFKNKLIKQFSPTTVPGQALIKLNKCYQRYDESVSQFATRIKLLGRDIYEEDRLYANQNELAGLLKKSQQLTLNQFKIGLKRDLIEKIGTILMREKNLDVEKAEEIAKFEELNQLQLKSRNKSQISHINKFVKKCEHCGKQNHLAENCWFKNKNKNNNREQNRNEKSQDNQQGNSKQQPQVHNHNKEISHKNQQKPTFNKYKNNRPKTSDLNSISVVEVDAKEDETNNSLN